MFEAAAFIVVLSLALVLYRTIVGPTLYDRVLAVNLAGTKTVVLLVIIGFAYDRPYFLDIAIAYALINFIATIAILKYRETGGLG